MYCSSQPSTKVWQRTASYALLKYPPWQEIEVNSLEDSLQLNALVLTMRPLRDVSGVAQPLTRANKVACFSSIKKSTQWRLNRAYMFWHTCFVASEGILVLISFLHCNTSQLQTLCVTVWEHVQKWGLLFINTTVLCAPLFQNTIIKDPLPHLHIWIATRLLI